MKKRKPPKLVVDNELPDDDEDGWKVICEQVADVHNRYPEIDTLLKRARETDDRAMWMAVVDLVSRYGMWRDIIAEVKREKLRVVKRKRDP
jgi:hypothetical protein